MNNPNISIRHLTIEDKYRLASLGNNPKVSINLTDSFPSPYTLADAEIFIERANAQYPITTFAVEYNGEYVGNISLTRGLDIYRKSALIGYFIGEPYWNKGITTEAVTLVVDFGFKHLDIERIHTGVFEYNMASRRVLEKCGFKQEGIFRNALYKNNQIYNEVRYAILKSDY
jgi:RimJ/RimL family protein N-acetyltransferase